MNDWHRTFKGINIAGHFSSDFGIGEAARSIVKAVESIGVPFVLNNLPVDTKVADTTYANFSTDNPYPINIVHMNPSLSPNQGGNALKSQSQNGSMKVYGGENAK